jgi:hypothetical protein
MTPLNCIAFLLSLYWVDWQNQARREHSHRGRQSRLPTWLHCLIYTPQPYHTNQKKLWKMEADDAF